MIHIEQNNDKKNLCHQGKGGSVKLHVCVEFLVGGREGEYTAE